MTKAIEALERISFTKLFYLDIFAQNVNQSEYEHSFNNNNNSNNSSNYYYNNNNSKILLERWVLKCEDNNNNNNAASFSTSPASSSSTTSSANGLEYNASSDLPSIYKNAFVMVRTIYSTALRLPAYYAYRKLQRNILSKMKLNFMISAKPQDLNFQGCFFFLPFPLFPPSILFESLLPPLQKVKKKLIQKSNVNHDQENPKCTSSTL